MIRLAILLFLNLILIHTNAQRNQAYSSPLTPINEDQQEIDIQVWLDDDKFVIIDFFTTWCAPCWAGHKAGIIENLMQKYGPNSSQDVLRTVAIEMSAKTNEYDFSHESDYSEGDWLEGITYPMVNLVNGIDKELYEGAYSVTGYPHLVILCPDGSWITSSYSLLESRLSILIENPNLCNSILAQDPHILSITGDIITCKDQQTVDIIYTNYGRDNLSDQQLVISEFINNSTEILDTIIVSENISHSQLDTVSYTLPSKTTRLRFEFIDDPLKIGNNIELQDIVYLEESKEFPEYDYNMQDFSVRVQEAGRLRPYIASRLYAKDVYPDMPIDIIFGRYDFKNILTNGSFKITYSKSAEILQRVDSLAIIYSLDCGDTWETIWKSIGSELTTHEEGCNNLIYRDAIIDVRDLSGQKDVLFGMRYFGTNQCDIFIDDIDLGYSFTVSNNDIVEPASFEVYPIPFNDVLTIKNLQSETEVSIYNCYGHLVNQSIINANNPSISTTTIIPGIYYIHIRDERKKEWIKLTKL
jgi:thiol-disulfide isomerase/thioredoxin